MSVVVAPTETVQVDRQTVEVVRESIDSVALISAAVQSVVVASSRPTKAVMLAPIAPMMIVAMGNQGPPGPAASEEETMPYSKRTDFASDTVIYKGFAAPGSLDSSPNWRILRMTIEADGDVKEQWAGGTADFVHAWDDRAALSYV